MFDIFPVFAGQPEGPNTRRQRICCLFDAEDFDNSGDPDVLRAPYLLPKQSLSSVWQLKT
jgi:hypothetical protein